MRPRIILIGGQVIRIIRKRSLGSTKKGKVVLGEYDTAKQTIGLLYPMRELQEFWVLWHETIHGILDVSGLGPNAIPDTVVDALGQGIAQVLMHNPHMRGDKWDKR